MVHTETQVAEHHAFHQPYLIVGRSAGSHLLLPHWEVSRRHALLQCLGDRVYAIDLGSRTGISPTDEADREFWMEADVGLRIGPYRLYPGRFGGDFPAIRHGWDWTERPRESFRERPGARLQPIVLRIEEDSGEYSNQVVDRVISLVGREVPADVVLPDAGVSKIHAALILTPLGLWAVDLYGRGGVLHEGIRVRHARIDSESSLQIGRFRLRVEAGGERVGDLAGEAGGGRRLVAGVGSMPGGSLAIEASGSVARDLVRREEYPQWLEPIPASAEHAWLIPVLQHIGTMQQQMMDQFNQSLMGALQSFGTLHRDTVSALREELGELRRLNEELAALQAQASVRNEAAQAEDSHPSVEAERPKIEREGRIEQGSPAAVPDQAVNSPKGSGVMRGEDSSRPEALADAHELHVTLQRRIRDLQRERQTRWQRILNVIQGAP